MTKNRIVGAVAALSLLAVPAVAAAHGSGDDHGRHHGHHHKHHGKKARDVTGAATGTVAAFAGGELTITLPSGKSFTADVTRRTAIKCKSAPTAAAASRHGDDDGDDHGSSTTPASTTAPPTTTVPAPAPLPDGRHGARCGTEALVVGAKVADAKLSLKGGGAIWKKVVLLK